MFDVYKINLKMDAYNKFVAPRSVVKYPASGYIQQPCDNHKITISTRKNNQAETPANHNVRNCHVDRENVNIYEENAMLRQERESLIAKYRFLQDLVSQLKDELECEKKSCTSFRRKSDMLEKELDTATKTLYTVKQLQESESRLQCQVEVLLTENKKLKLKESEMLTEIRQLKNEKDVMVMDYQRYAKQLHQIFNCKLEKKDKLCQEYESKLKEILENNLQSSPHTMKSLGATQIMALPGSRTCPHDIPRLNLSSSSTDLLNLNSCNLEQDFSSGTDSLRKEDDMTDEETLDKATVVMPKILMKIESPNSEKSVCQIRDSPLSTYATESESHGDNEPSGDSNGGAINHVITNLPLTCTEIDKGENVVSVEETEIAESSTQNRLKGGAVKEEAEINYQDCSRNVKEKEGIHISDENNLLASERSHKASTSLISVESYQKSQIENKISHEELIDHTDDNASVDHDASAEIIDILRGVNSPSPPFSLSESGDCRKAVDDFFVGTKVAKQIAFEDEATRSPVETKVNGFETDIITIGVPKPLKCCLSSQSLNRASSVVQQAVKRTHSFTSIHPSWFPEALSVDADISTKCSLITNPNSIWKKYTLMKNVMPAGHLKKTLDVLSFK